VTVRSVWRSSRLRPTAIRHDN